MEALEGELIILQDKKILNIFVNEYFIEDIIIFKVTVKNRIVFFICERTILN